MTFEELLKQCADGKMPQVIYNGKVCQVVTIKRGDGYHGVGVNIGNKWVDWFHAENGNDKRKRYMSQLSPVESKECFAVGALVRLKTNHEEHRGKHFKVENIDTSLIKVSWQNRIYYFYDSELEVVNPNR